jgi:lysophospholipase L1-like esterase
MRLDRDVIDRNPRPDVCIVLAGVNDLQNDVPGRVIIANLDAMYWRLLEAGVQPIALSIYPFGEHSSWTSEREALRQEVRTWMLTELPGALPEVEVVDVEDVIGDLSDAARPRIRAEFAQDSGLHTSPAGAAAVARALVERSRSLGGRGLSPGPGVSMS